MLTVYRIFRLGAVWKYNAYALYVSKVLPQLQDPQLPQLQDRYFSYFTR